MGICVACSAGVCASCSTRLQGRNFCVLCLAERANSDADAAVPAAGAALRWLVALSALASGVVLMSVVTSLGLLLYLMG